MKSVKTLLGTTFSGRRFTRKQLGQAQETVERFPNLSRNELAHTVCEHLNWKTPNGKNKVESCLVLLEELEAHGVVSLPAKQARQAPQRRLPILEPDTSQTPIEATLRTLLENLDGQLTATLHLAAADHPLAARLLPVLERRAGRIVVNGWPTGVEVCHAMVHGGPFPATSDSRSTSVGTLAIERFLRPVCYQDVPQELLPPELRDDAADLPRRVDGRYEAP